MTHNSRNRTRKSSPETKEIKLVALTVCSAIAAIVGYSVMTSTASVEAHRVSSDQVKTTEIADVSPIMDEKTDHDSVDTIVDSKKIESTQAQKPANVDDDKDQTAASGSLQDPAAQASEPSAATPKDSAAETTADAQEPVAAQTSTGVHDTTAPAQPAASTPDPALAAPVQTAPSNPVPVVETGFEPFEDAGTDGNATLPVLDAAATVNDSGIPDNQIWHVHYVSSWGAGSAPVDGSVGLWADGWFIAHSHMPNGDMIASQPAYVEVDGQIYALKDSWVSDDYVTTDEVARARANNGIVFQTCITDTTNRLVHYEPVDGPGYPYQFDQFPYTFSDHAILGV